MKFEKYQGTGNDFILVDARGTDSNDIEILSPEKIQQLCDRKFGIGSDGLVLIKNRAGFDFEMDFYNPDASKSFCGNGARCAVAFAHKLRIFDKKCTFWGIDGAHEAVLKHDSDGAEVWVEVKMNEVSQLQTEGTDTFILNTGSPHFVRFVADVAAEDMYSFGKKIRYSSAFAPAGINVNLATTSPRGIALRTYERGVENETLSCGTGVTAAALAYHRFAQRPMGANTIAVQTLGGLLSVRFEANTAGGFSEIWLCGPATFVFGGTIFI